MLDKLVRALKLVQHQKKVLGTFLVANPLGRTERIRGGRFFFCVFTNPGFLLTLAVIGGLVGCLAGWPHPRHPQHHLDLGLPNSGGSWELLGGFVVWG